MQPSFERDVEALPNFLEFDTKMNILRRNTTGKPLSPFIVCCTEFVCLQNRAFSADSYGGLAFIRVHRSAGG